MFSVFALGALALVVPFIGFGGPSYDRVAADAAKMYNLDIKNYEVIVAHNIVNASGEHVLGMYRVSTTSGPQSIFIQKSWSRPMVIATIFHEFAHAAQRAHNLDRGGLNDEQHAEVLSFQTMWHSKYAYNAVHLLWLHLFAKPAEYRATHAIWRMAFNGGKQ